MARMTGGRDGRSVEAELAVYLDFAESASRPGHPDSILREMLRVVLTATSQGIQFHLTNLLQVSPYASALTKAALHLIDTPGVPAETLQLATYLISRLVTPDTIDVVAALTQRSNPDLVRIGLIAATHLRYDIGDDLLRKLASQPQTRAMAVYYAGMSQHPLLQSHAFSGPSVDWWRNRSGGCWD